jgi:hypothetical protein
MHFAKKSLAMNMRIRRLERPTPVVAEVRSATLVVGAEIEEKSQGELGWSMLLCGNPIHVQRKSSLLKCPETEFPARYWPYRTSLLKRKKGIYHVFEQAEEWEAKPKKMVTGEEPTTIITILSLEPGEVEDFGFFVEDTARWRARQARRRTRTAKGRRSLCLGQGFRRTPRTRPLLLATSLWCRAAH